MIVLFLILWFILNGRATWEIFFVGLAISLPVYWFFCHFLDYSPRKEVGYVRRIGFGIRYLFVLMAEIVKANFQVMKLILSSELEVEPKLVRFRTKLKKPTNLVALSNSITLTPGTITIEAKDGEFLVHALDKDFAEGIESSVFVEMLEENETKGSR